MKAPLLTERIQLGALRGVAEYLPTRVKGSRVITGWTLRLDVPGTDYRIEGFAATQEGAREMFIETVKEWLKDTNRKPVIT
jgi:hypothetical protein